MRPEQELVVRTDETVAPEIDFEERVRNGIAFLDEQDPGWRQRINFERLNLASCWGCILGQLYERFEKGVVRYDLNLERAEQMGFLLIEYRSGDYERLQEAWERALDA